MPTDSSSSAKTALKEIPLLPLQDILVFPSTVVPLFVGREIHSGFRASNGNKQRNSTSGSKEGEN